MILPDLFIAGLPGCGKSYFGAWLEKEHGYVHVDFERELPALFRSHRNEILQFIRERRPQPLLGRLKEKSTPIAFDWGFPVNCLDIARFLALELTPYWFQADIQLARASFIQRGTSPAANFEIQLTSITRRMPEISQIFPHCNRITTIVGSRQKIPPRQIMNLILKREEATGEKPSI